MTRRPVAPAVLWTLQWLLAATFFLVGLLKYGLPVEDVQLRLRLVPGAPESQLQLAGLLEVLAALTLVIPSLAGFWPRLGPLAATYLAISVAVGAAAPVAATGFGWPLVDLALAASCAAVAVGRGFLWPVAPIELGPELVEPGAPSLHLGLWASRSGRRSVEGLALRPLGRGASRLASRPGEPPVGVPLPHLAAGNLASGRPNLQTG